MATISTKTGNGGQGIFHGTARTLTCFSRAAALTMVLAAAATAQAADSTDRIIPPNPADVAVLRQLLALQHPSLREGAVPPSPGSATPAVATTPGQQTSQTPPSATQGEACISPDGSLSPDGKSKATCGFGAEADSSRSAKLGSTFRASLDRAMAAAGFDGAHL